MFLKKSSVILLCTLFFTLLALSCKEEKNGIQRPNVVLIVIDDLGWRDLGFMGSKYYETPNLDSLAAESMVFMNAYASASNCAPSRANMISGLQSPSHGVFTVSPSDRGKTETRKLIPIKNTKHLSDDEYTLHDMFKSERYVTGSFGKWHVGSDPTAQGVDVNVGGSHRGNPGRDGYFSPYKIDNIENGPEGEYLTDRLTSEAISFVEENQQNPFFLYVPFYTVHTPIQAKKDLIERFENKETQPGQENATYAAMVHSMDQNIGRLLQSIKHLRLEEKTLVIVTSDNGGIRAISDQAPLRAGKGSYYEGGIRVPLIINFPKQIASGVNYERVTNLDFFPTLQNLIKASKTKHNLAGVDLSPLIFDEASSLQERDLFWHFPIYLQAYRPLQDDGRDPLFRTRPGSVMISGNWKLHEYFEDETFELYNIKDDPGERKNLAGSEIKKLNELRILLEKWRKDNNAPVPTKRNPAYDSDIEQELIEQLSGKEI